MEKKILFDDDLRYSNEINYLVELKKIFPYPNPTELKYPKSKKKKKEFKLFKFKNINCKHYEKCLDWVGLQDIEWWNWDCSKCWWRKNKDRLITLEKIRSVDNINKII